jgi:hypothetical protein
LPKLMPKASGSNCNFILKDLGVSFGIFWCESLTFFQLGPPGLGQAVDL